MGRLRGYGHLLPLCTSIPAFNRSALSSSSTASTRRFDHPPLFRLRLYLRLHLRLFLCLHHHFHCYPSPLQDRALDRPYPCSAESVLS